MTILITAHLYKGETKFKDLTVELDKFGRPPNSIKDEGEIYFLHTHCKSEAKYIMRSDSDDDIPF